MTTVDSLIIGGGQAGAPPTPPPPGAGDHHLGLARRGGQAGLALSRLLADAGNDHVVLERGVVGERWRSERWDSLALLTPNWANRLPGDAAPADEDGYRSGPEFLAALQRYAWSFGAPVREHTTVTSVERA